MSSDETKREISYEQLKDHLLVAPMPESGELQEILITYDNQTFKKFGNFLDYNIIGDFSIGAVDGVINEMIDCDQDIILNTEEKEILKNLEITTNRVSKMRTFLEYVYTYPENISSFKVDILESIFNCRTISKETQLSFISYLATEDKKLLKGIDLDPNSRKIYESLRNLPLFKKLTNIDKKVDILKILCVDPNNTRTIPDEYFKVIDPDNPQEIGNIIKLARQTIEEEKFRLEAKQ